MAVYVHDDERRAFDRLRDENEQLRTALESAHEEVERLATDRERMLATISGQTCDLYRSDAKHRSITSEVTGQYATLLKKERSSETEEELRVALEEMQVLTEELEVANQTLIEQNEVLDRRVAERTAELGAANVALAASEASFRAVADLVPDYLWRSDAAGHVRWFSRRWYAMTGQDEHEALGNGWLAAVHPDDRERVQSAQAASLAAGEPYEAEARVEGWRGGARWVLMRAEPVRGEDGRIAHWFGAGTDIHEQRLTHDALEASERRFRTLGEGIPQLVWRSRAGGDWTWASPQWTQCTGLSDEASRGRGWLEAWHPDDRAAALAAWDRAGVDGDLAAEGRIFAVHEGRYRHFRTRAKAVVAADGRSVEWLGTSTDVDDVVRLQQQQEVLVAELQHRTRNILAVVQSVVRRTMKGSEGLDDFGDRVEARLGALARVQGLLSQRADNRRINFDQLLRTELSAHVALDADGKGAQVALSGPSGVHLYSATIQTMALALHELATNAVKYGALAAPAGHLDICWRLLEEGEPRLFVEWRERGVADVPEPGARPRGGGYGRELIERALPYQLHAKTSYGFEKDGVRCTIEVPVAREETGGAV